MSTSDANSPSSPPQAPAYRIPIRLTADEHTRAHATAHTAGQNLEAPVHDRITDALDTEQSDSRFSRR
nr:hypothetical protein [Rhodococcus wratislaviensis]GLK39735.1 hypothetical protein GCM10017611_66060 [Rhodococcus wratislaviensis]